MCVTCAVLTYRLENLTAVSPPPHPPPHTPPVSPTWVRRRVVFRPRLRNDVATSRRAHLVRGLPVRQKTHPPVGLGQQRENTVCVVSHAQAQGP